jgi:hypothetical protein
VLRPVQQTTCRKRTDGAGKESSKNRFPSSESKLQKGRVVLAQQKIGGPENDENDRGEEQPCLDM